MDYLISKIVLMVSGIAASRGRHYTFCLLYFYVWALFKYCAPSAAPWGHHWYWLCILSESSIIAIALIVRPNAKGLIIFASMIQILANSASLITPAIYSYYPIIIRSMEITQLSVMIIGSQGSFKVLGWAKNKLERAKGTVWTLFRLT